MMAAAAAGKWVGQLGTNSGMSLVVGASKTHSIMDRVSSAVSPLTKQIYCRRISQLANSNGKRLFLVDTLALVRRLEGQGVPSKQAEAITAAITEVLNDTIENASQSFVSKGEIQKIEMIQEANVSKFKSEVQSSQGHHFLCCNMKLRKLRNDIEKMRSELRYEIDKVTAGQRLDLNLERGRIRDELNNQSAETTNLTNKLDKVRICCAYDLEKNFFQLLSYLCLDVMQCQEFML
ncbi:protein FMP32, mitochondrial-like isoform X1 [Prosopis cineraria]|uniref:protein FMP32, mitochondrial-like isoform X1 n=1 Tax=Prosopis cineraria TaxID=364024 RepID=UPI0024106AD5|nr:protein FMP32, mitochondrial-like isoform X1 [Prosopis cineraria]